MSKVWTLQQTAVATRSERRALHIAAITLTVVAILVGVALFALTARPVSAVLATPLLGLALVAAYLRARVG